LILYCLIIKKSCIHGGGAGGCENSLVGVSEIYIYGSIPLSNVSQFFGIFRALFTISNAGSWNRGLNASWFSGRKLMGYTEWYM